jgi:hypothetical protein
MKSVITFAAGFASGWAVRSLGDSPHGVGVKLMEVAQKTKDKVQRWAAVEYERFADMFAEAQSRANPNAPKDPNSSQGLKAVH